MSATDFPREAVAAELRRGLEQAAFDEDVPESKLLDYLALLHRWNRAFNLSAIREPMTMVAVHLLDSLSLLPYLEGPSLLDVGSGAGLPGIPLALCRPELNVTVLDSNGKKTRFMEQVRLQLGLPALSVVHQRIESFRAPAPFATVCSRAFARVDAFVAAAGEQVREDGVMLAMKGRFDAAGELQDLPAGWRTEHLPLQVPGLDAQRSLVRIRRLLD